MPLDNWICDACGDRVTDPSGGLVINRRDDEGRAYDFKVVHKGKRCDPGARSDVSENVEISSYLGAAGQAALLSLLSAGPIIGQPQRGVASLDEFVDLFRRFQTAWYEEARPHFHSEDTEDWLGDVNESYPYTPDVLERIAKRNLG